MERGGAEQQPDEQQGPRQEIQREIIKLHKEFFGRGPIKSKLYMHPDSVLVLMYQGHTRVEESLRQAGERRSVAQGESTSRNRFGTASSRWWSATQAVR